jgi:signal transduction histidine kinase
MNFRQIHLIQLARSRNLVVLFLLFASLASHNSMGQRKTSIQVKAFDQQLKPFSDAEIAFNDLDYFRTNGKGTAIVELDSTQIPIRNVRIRDGKMEAASWNLSKGIAEIIVRPRSYRLVQFIARFADGSPLIETELVFNGIAPLRATTDKNGGFELPVGFNDQIRSVDQFSIPNLNVINLTTSEKENVITVERPRARELPVKQAPVVAQPERPRHFHTSDLDSIKSLSSFYAFFSRIAMSNLGAEDRAVIDAKFRKLVAAKEDSIVAAQSRYVRRISDSSVVAEDIRNLVLQATLEEKTLDQNRADFESRITVITQKLQRGVVNLTSADRATLLQDIDHLEKILTDNESKFYQNHNDYRQIIATLKQQYFNIQNLESRLSAAEKQSEEDRRKFRQQMVGIGGVVVVFGLLIILLIYFSTRLRKQTQSLQRANNDIEIINENLESIVKRRTHLLQEANKELDTFLYRASHDLRSPVRTIIGLCQIMEHIPPQEMVARVEHATHTMDRVLNKLIDISEIGPETIRVEEVDVHAMIGRIRNQQLVIKQGVSVFRNNTPIFINKRPVQFDVDCTDDLKVLTSPSLMEIIIANLVENAIFFSGLKKDANNARVQIAATMHDEKLHLTIFDNGVGITESVKPRLFSMFFTGHEASKGNGLGLYAVNKCVQALQGSVSIESEEGKFTRVTVIIPPSKKETPRKESMLQREVKPATSV